MITRAWLGGYDAATPWKPWDDRWYESRAGGGPIHAGVRAGETEALGLSAPFACCRIIAGTEAMVPFGFYRWVDRDRGDKEPVRNHPVYRLLNRRPNAWQTAIEFREQMTFLLALHGNSYAEIIRERGFPVALEPHHPGRVVLEKMPRANRSRVRYHVTDDDGKVRVLLQDEVMHLRDIVVDKSNVCGTSRLVLMRQGLGLAIAAERHGARFYGKGGKSAIHYSTDETLTPTQRKEFDDHFAAKHGHPDGSHEPLLLSRGVKPIKIDYSAKDAQSLETREFQVEESARWYGIPLHMIQHEKKDTAWGSGLSEMAAGFVRFNMQVWYGKWEQAVARDLLTPAEVDELFGAHEVDALMRGDLPSQYEMFALSQNSNRPWHTDNEIRRAFNLRPWPGGDERPAPTVNVGTTEPGSALYDGYGRELKVAA